MLVQGGVLGWIPRAWLHRPCPLIQAPDNPLGMTRPLSQDGKYLACVAVLHKPGTTPFDVTLAPAVISIIKVLDGWARVRRAWRNRFLAVSPRSRLGVVDRASLHPPAIALETIWPVGGAGVGQQHVALPRSPVRLRRLIGRIAFYCLAFGFVQIFALPFYWEIITALKPLSELYLMPPRWLPSRLYLQSFITIFTERQLGLFMLNSLTVASMTTVIAIGVGSLAAYAIARLPIRGRTGILIAMLSASMFPGTALIGPLFVVISDLRLVNTFEALVWTYISFALPFAVWLLANFFAQIPVELEEAAEVDGATPLEALLRISLPLALPGLASAAILVFIGSWNEFFFALTFSRTDAVRTVPVVIAAFTGVHDEVPWGEMSAAADIVVFPIIAATIVLQKRIIRGLTAGALRE